MKIHIKVIVSLLLIVGCLVCSTGCTNKKSEEEIAIDYIERCSRMELPIDSKLVYLLSDEAKGFQQGNVFQYTVFQLKNEPADWLNENSFDNSLDENKSNKFERFFSSALSDIPERVGEIDQEFLPNFEKFYYYLKTEDVYFVYLPQDLLLITIIPND